MKDCRRCLNTLADAAFKPNLKLKSGLDSWCRACCSAKALEIYYRNHEENKKKQTTRQNKKYAECEDFRETKIKHNNDRYHYDEMYRESVIASSKANIKRRELDPTDPLKIWRNCRKRLYIAVNELLDVNIGGRPFRDVVGCSPEELRQHLESKFQPGMTWDNWSRTGWHIDHMIALSSHRDEESILKLCHYTNLQPLWAKDNLKKGRKSS